MLKLSGNDALTKLIQDVKTEIKGANNNSSKISQKISRIIEFPDDVTQLRVKNPIYMNNESGYIIDATDGNRTIFARDGNIWMRHAYHTGWITDWIKLMTTTLERSGEGEYNTTITGSGGLQQTEKSIYYDFRNGIRILSLDVMPTLASPTGGNIHSSNKSKYVSYVRKIVTVPLGQPENAGFTTAYPYIEFDILFPVSFFTSNYIVLLRLDGYESSLASTIIHVSVKYNSKIQLIFNKYFFNSTEYFANVLNVTCIGRWK